MEEKIKCGVCNREFKEMGGLNAHNKAKHPELISKERKSLPVKKIRNLGIIIVALGLIISGIYFIVANIETLPPIDIAGHIEVNPPAHILKEPMAITIQKHMLEHADGVEGGRGGVVINYNCRDYSCEDNLISNLEGFAVKYDYVYVAPFKGMDAKIALTKFNKREILDDYDNEAIEMFIKY